MIDDRRRRTAGLAAYASQFNLPASEVEAHLSSLIGPRMAARIGGEA